jgi:sulfatase maturation enzyme AslB (radical SAM superfamily)
MKMDRIYPLLHKLINHYPYFDTMFSSTNYSYPEWTDQVLNLMKIFGEYPERDFAFDLQLSADGPEYINDRGRGAGVTKRCVENFNLLLDRIDNGELPDNVELNMYIKATLDNTSLHALNNKQSIIEYFQFFENVYGDAFNRIRDRHPNVTFALAHPNTAVPSPVTVEDGKEFAEICRLCREIERENKTAHYFKYYNEITIFSNDVAGNDLTYKYSHHTCGSGTSMIGFMPDNMLSTCHEGFTQFAMEYKKLAAISERDRDATITFDKFLSEQTLPYCVDEKGYAEHMRKMGMFNNNNTSARLVNLVA